MKILYVPNVNVNEDVVSLTSWRKQKGERVTLNEVVCEIETTKSTFDVESEAEGFIQYQASVGAKLKVGSVLAVITDSQSEDVSAVLSQPVITPEKPDNQPSSGRRITKKAELLAKKLGLDLDSLGDLEGDITESVINKIAASKTKVPTRQSEDSIVAIQTDDLVDGPHPYGRQERVLILGAGGGCNLVLDILSRSALQRGVIILDSSRATHNKSLMGTKVLGDMSLLDELFAAGKFDAVISTIVRDNAERAEIFDQVSRKGIPFTNVISDMASIRSNVKMGTGNLIISRSYVAPSVTMGNNNFLAAGTIVEHHSKIGNHCTFGPGFTASGKVQIGDLCKFGMGVFVEPFVEIGANSTVASGAVLTSHIPANSIVKTENRLKIKSK